MTVLMVILLVINIVLSIVAVWQRERTIRRFRKRDDD